MTNNNKTWKNILKKTLKQYPKKSIKNILLKTKKKYNMYQKKRKIKIIN